MISSGGPDLSPQVVADSGGPIWVAWQGYRDGRSRILARSFDGKAWGAETAVSENTRNAWEPAIAVDGMSVTIKGTPAAGDRFDITPAAPNLDVFGALDHAIATLKNPAANAGQLAQVVREWRATAEVYADPLLSRRLRRPVDTGAGQPVMIPVAG